MKKFSVTITEDAIRERCEMTVSDAIEDGEITFPDEEARAEFIEDLIQGIIDKYSIYGPYEYSPSYYTDVLDLADLYGYSK